MGTIITVNGKGGTGKTTIAALIVAHLARIKAGSILAIDADPNSCFADALGVTGAQTIVGVVEDVSKHLGAMPAGMTKDRHIEMRVQESLAETDRFDLLVMGRPEGPGCYCYVNNLLRELIGEITAGYDYVVIDNAAGMEHISRRTMRQTDAFLLVSDYSVAGIRSVRRIHELARELGITMAGAYLVINKIAGSLAMLADEIRRIDLPVAGTLPYDEELMRWQVDGKNAIDFGGRCITDEIEKIVQMMTSGR